MNVKEETKARFQEYQKNRFIWDMNHSPSGYIDPEWEKATREYLNPLLRGKSLEEYFDGILTVMDEMLDKGVLPITLAEVVGQWTYKISAAARNIIKRWHYEEYKSETPKRIFEKHRKTIKPQLVPYVNAFKILQKLAAESDFSVSEQVGLAGYLENNDLTHVQPPLAELGNALKDSVLNQSGIDVQVKTVADLEERLRKFYPDFLEVTLEIKGKNDKARKFFFELRNHAYGLSMILDHLKGGVELFAEKRFGYEGRLIAQALLEDLTLKGIDNELLRPAHRPRHKPEDVYLNRIILHLYEESVDEILVARLINAFENRDHYKLLHKGLDAEWQVRKQQMVSAAEYRVRKAIRQRIKKSGGNSLRYEIDLLIKEKKECRRCDWRYDERGVLVRAVPCNSHKQAGKEIGVSFASPGWRQSLEKRGLKSFANALTFA